MIVIECSAFLAAMKANTVSGACPRPRRRPLHFKDLALLGQDLDLASQPAQLLALVLLRPSALPSSTSLWATQFRSEPSETPSSLAICGTARPLSRNSFTASRLSC
jgi:hypothetical protein